MTDETFQPPSDRPADRYGTKPASPARKRWLTVGVGGLALVAMAWWLWIAVVHSNPPVRYDLVGFHPVSATSVEIRFSVVREPGLVVACVLRARGSGGAEVGRRQVVVPAAAIDRTDLTSTVTTTALAVTGEVLACQPYDESSGLVRLP
jgi:hypothetical protein